MRILNPATLWILRLVVVCAILPAGCTTTPETEGPRGLSMWHGSSARKIFGTEAQQEISPEQQRINLFMANGRSLEMDGEDGGAVELYQNVLAEDPNHTEASHRLAVIHSRKGQFSEAEPFFLIGMTHDADNPDLLCDLGYACYLQERWDEAEQHFRRSIKHAPSHKRAHVSLGMLYARQGRVREARDEFAAGGCTSAQVKANLAFASMLQADWDRAIALYGDALTREPAMKTAGSGIRIAHKMKVMAQTQRPDAPQVSQTVAGPRPPVGMAQPNSAIRQAAFHSISDDSPDAVPQQYR